MCEENGLHGILNSCGSCIDNSVLESGVVEWITFSDSSEIFDANDLNGSGACV